MVSTTSVLNWLKSHHHICASTEWCEACIEWIQDEYQGTQLRAQRIQELVYEQWLHVDLRDLAEPSLPQGLNTQEKTVLRGFYCLQVESVRDVGKPAYSQLQKLSGGQDPEELISTATQPTQRWQANSSRMLMLQMTDGSQTMQGMEYRPCPELDVDMQPGCKIQIHGNIQCRLGVLLLTASNIKVLGGEVETLQEDNSQVMVLSRALNVEAPDLPHGDLIAGRSEDRERMSRSTESIDLTAENLTLNQHRIQQHSGADRPSDQRTNNTQGPSNTNTRQTHQQWGNRETVQRDEFKQQPSHGVQHIQSSTGMVSQPHNNKWQEPTPRHETMEDNFMDLDDEDELFDADVLQQLDEIELQMQDESTATSGQPTNHNAIKHDKEQRKTPLLQIKTENPNKMTNDSTISTRTDSSTTTSLSGKGRQFSNKPQCNYQDASIESFLLLRNKQNTKSVDNLERNHSHGDGQDQKKNRLSTKHSTAMKLPDSVQVGSSTRNRQFTSSSTQSIQGFLKPLCRQETTNPVKRTASPNCLQEPIKRSVSPVCKQEPIERTVSPVYNQQGLIKRTVSPASHQGPIRSTVSPVCKQEPIERTASPMGQQGPTKRTVSTMRGNDIDCFVDMEVDFDDVDFKNITEEENLPDCNGVTLDYLSDVVNQLPVQERRIINIKGFIMTLLSSLSCQPVWNMKVRINDGSSSLDVVLSDDVLTELIGFSVPQMKKMKKESKGNMAKLQKGIQQCQQALIDLCCIMEIELSPQQERPMVISLTEVTSNHYQGLCHKVENSI
ncbi:recQ-mediated genome instability protein 1-like [Glandiceps talaboti]